MHLNRINNSCKKARRPITAALGKTWSLAYNSAGDLSQITDPLLNETRLSTDTLGRHTSTFDAADRLSQIKYTKSDATLIDQIDYTYDAAGQRISKTMLNGNSSPETPMTATFDAGNRMQTITLNPGKPEQKIYTLSYDNNGNLTKKQLSTDASCTADCTEYVWDSRNRLTQIKQNQTSSATYSYDAENRRIQTNITSNGATNQVSYIYAGSQSFGEVRNQQLSHSLMTGLQMDEHIARIALNQGATPQVKTYLTDALGSVIAIAKADQSLEVGYAFSPYGQTQKAGVEGEVAGSENSSQYTGRENDNNGLYFYRARYYDPILKRFISEDPIGLAGGINSHAYVGGNPVSLVDPEGLAGTIPKKFGKDKPINPLPNPYNDGKKVRDDAQNPVDAACLVGFKNCEAEYEMKKAMRCAPGYYVCPSNKRDQPMSCPRYPEMRSGEPEKKEGCICLKMEFDPIYKAPLGYPGLKP